MNLNLAIRLCAMMFLQYFVWGLWMPFLGVQLEQVPYISASRVGYISMMLGFGSIIGPFILAQLADRYFAAEKVMAITHMLGGLMLIATSYARNFWVIIFLFFIYCNLYFATIGLSNSITFRNVGEKNQNLFPIIRLFGTIGWIIAGWLLSAFLWSLGSDPFVSLYQLLLKPELMDTLWLAGIASIAYGGYSFGLPHTPPVPAKETDPIDKRSAVLESLELMRSRSFTVLVATSGLVGVMLAFYFQCEAFFLIDIGVVEQRVPFYMTIGQIAEIFIMLLVPLSVAKFGVKNTMLIGMAAWGVRFGLSMIGYPLWLMISTIALHGFCFGFLIVVAQMYVDRAASMDIKSSAQNLLTVVVYGIGTVIGNLAAGWLRDAFRPNWTVIWAIPFFVTLLTMTIFALYFREKYQITGGGDQITGGGDAETAPT